MTVKIRQQIERRIVSRLVKDILSFGFAISVWDGEAYPLQMSLSYRSIMDAIMSTDDDVLEIHHLQTGRYIGSVVLVYGNDGYDVISDYSAPKNLNEMDRLTSGAFALASKLEK